MENSQVLLNLSIKRQSNGCPFSNEALDFSIRAGECFWLQGDSGAGKTTTIRALAKISPLPGAKLKADWQKGIPKKRRIGVLFQKGVLIDTLSVYENIALSCAKAGLPHDKKTILTILKSVDLTADDGKKMPGELSGGMLRRASLAQILSQRKEVIVLDEPFVGLDKNTAQGIIKTLQKLRDAGQAFILIAHEADYAEQLATPDCGVHLTTTKQKPRLHSKWVPHWRYIIRLWQRIIDYVGISFPLIVFAFVATGVAASMVFIQLLAKVNMQMILAEVAKHQPHWGFAALFFLLVKHAVIHLTHDYLPIMKEKLYVVVIMRAFVTQLGPLLTALLLAGRIGGSYTGEIAMMQATNQNNLLRTLGISPRWWTLSTASVAALLAAPILTVAGTATGVYMGAWASVHGPDAIFPNMHTFWQMIYPKIFSWEGVHHWFQYPPYVNLYQSIGFMVIIIWIAEVTGRSNKFLQPRNVPKTITWSIVITSLLIILADWGFTEILVRF